MQQKKNITAKKSDNFDLLIGTILNKDFIPTLTLLKTYSHCPLFNLKKQEEQQLGYTTIRV